MNSCINSVGTRLALMSLPRDLVGVVGSIKKYVSIRAFRSSF